MSVESFDDVRNLAKAELEALLERGRPEERVWAIWALALQSADIATLGSRTEPDPGVRRNLAVVLAGHGQLDLLVALARRDPAAVVRAAAMQLVARIAIDGKLPHAIVVERIANEGPEVKAAVLGTVFAGAPSWLVEIAQQLVEDLDSDVRYEAFEALLRAGADAHALMWLEEAPESEARIALMRWSARGRVHACAVALAAASRRLRRLLVESVRDASWRDLAPAIGSEPALIRAVARRVHSVFEEMPLATLLAATLREPVPDWLRIVRDRLATLASPDSDLGDMLHDYIDICERRIREIDTLVSEIRRHPDSNLRGDPDYQADLEGLDLERVALESAIDHASRMLVH